MRSSTARRAVVFGSAALLLLGSTGTTASAEPAPNPGPNTAEVAAALPAELSQAVARDLKLTAEQYLQRADLSQQLAAFTERIRAEYPDSFAGAWMDESGRAIVALAESPTLAEARSLVESAGYDVKSVAKNEISLRNEKSAFDKWLASQPTEIASLFRGVVIDIVNNAIAIRVERVAGGLHMPSFLDPARIVVTPPAVGAEVITPVADAAGELPTDALGGGDAYASSSNSGASLRCSLGFNATDGSGHAVNVSAGHCDPNLAAAGTPSATTVHELRPLDVLGPRLGTFDKTMLEGHDYSIIRVDENAVARFTNNIVRVPNAAPLAITGVARPVIGAPVCKSGARTGFSCGVVNAVEQSVLVGDRYLNDSFSATICALPGDSGGAVVTGTQALGISSASSVAEYPICEIPNLIGPFIGNTPTLFATSVDVVVRDNPGLRIRTS